MRKRRYDRLQVWAGFHDELVSLPVGHLLLMTVGETGQSCLEGKTVDGKDLIHFIVGVGIYG